MGFKRKNLILLRKDNLVLIKNANNQEIFHPQII